MTESQGATSPSYKRLKSVAHNLGHSYLSLMNYQDDEYVVERLFQASRASGEAHVEIDVLAGRIGPETFETPALVESVQRMRAWLPRSFEAEGCNMDTARAVKLWIDFRLAETRRSEHVPGLELPAYDCRVEILDDRGVVHSAKVPEWWRY